MEQHDESTERCRQLFAMLSEYLDLELPPDACAEVESHLAGCPPCIEFAESLRMTVEICKRYCPSEMPAPISDSARAALLAAWQKMAAGRRHLSE